MESSEPTTILRRNNRVRRPPIRYPENEFDGHFALSAEQYSQGDPPTIKEEKCRDDWKSWRVAIEAEYNLLINNKTSTLCDLERFTPSGFLKIKLKFDGSIDKYKIRLCAKGFCRKKILTTTKLMHR